MQTHFINKLYKSFLITLFLLFSIESFAQKTVLDSLIKVSNHSKDDSVKALNFISISNKYRTEKLDYANAQKYVKLSSELSKKINFPEGTYKSLLAQAFLIRDMGSNKTAIEELKNAISFFESDAELMTNPNLYINHINNYTALADLYTYLPDYASAQKYAFMALALSEKHNTGSGNCWLTLSIVFSKQKNLEEANKYALKATDFFKKNNAWDDLARSYAFLANYAYSANDYTKAIEYYLLSYDFYKKANSQYGMRIAYYNLAEIYLKIKDYEKADYYSNETLKIKGSENDFVYLFYINQLRYNILFDKKNYTEALTVSKTILELARKEKDLKNVSIAYENQYSVYKALKDNANALEMIEKISSLKDSIYDTDIAKNTADLAKKYETEKQIQQIKFLEKENILNKEKIAQELELKIALRNENIFKEAKLFQEQLLAVSLSKNNELKDLEIQQRQLIQQGLERENNLKKKELNKEKELNKSLGNKNKNESLIRWLLVLIVVFFFLMAFNNYRHLKKQKAANKKINQQAEGLKTLLKETHHRVKNNLQLTISMLRMQARNIDKKTAKEALVNSENRLQTIAMVHEKLYSSEILEGILLKDYIKELIEVLEQQYYDDNLNIKYKLIDNSGLVTNLDSAVLIGLIINELITNAVKYAFDNNNNNNIIIEIKPTNNHNYQLLVRDNGKGLPDNFDLNQINTLGLHLVALFAEQLNGSFEFKNNNGACFIIGFPVKVT